MNAVAEWKLVALSVVAMWSSAASPSLLQEAFASSGNSASQQETSSTSLPAEGKLLYKDDFKHGLKNWKIEEESPGRITADHGVLDIDVPAGATVWFRSKLQGPILVEYEATVISNGGPNDRGSDLNCFWMATDPKHPDDLFSVSRRGGFAEYNTLLTYYVGLGGNGNTTTRFRRYIGSASTRPLLAKDDLSDKAFLIEPNKSQVIRLLADGNTVAFYRDSHEIFRTYDPHPYTQGWFALRTTKNHMEIRHLRIYRSS